MRGEAADERQCACAEGTPAAILQRQPGGEASPAAAQRGRDRTQRRREPAGRAVQANELKSRRRRSGRSRVAAAPRSSGFSSSPCPPLLSLVPTAASPGLPPPPPACLPSLPPCLPRGRPHHAVRAAAAQGEQPLQADPGEPPVPLLSLSLSPPSAGASPFSSPSHAGLARCPPPRG